LSLRTHSWAGQRRSNLSGQVRRGESDPKTAGWALRAGTKTGHRNQDARPVRSDANSKPPRAARRGVLAGSGEASSEPKKGSLYLPPDDAGSRPENEGAYQRITACAHTQKGCAEREEALPRGPEGRVGPHEACPVGDA